MHVDFQFEQRCSDPVDRGAGSSTGGAAETVMTVAPVGVADVRLKRLVGPIFRDLKRLRLNLRHRRLAEWLVECTVARGFLWLYAPRLEFLGGPLGFSRSEVHEILKGYHSPSGPVAGLVELGLVRWRECGREDGGVLSLMPVASRWDAPLVYTTGEHAAALAEVEAVRLGFAAQSEAAEIAEFFPDLSALVDEALVTGMLAAAGGGGQHLPTADVSKKSDGVDARLVGAERRGPPNRRPCSEKLNVDLAAGAVPLARARAVGIEIGTEIKSETLPIGRPMEGQGMSREAVKSGLTVCEDAVTRTRITAEERVFCEAAEEVIGARNWRDGRPERYMGDGSKWRNRWRHGPSRAVVIKALLDVYEFGARNPAAAAQVRWREFGGDALDAMRAEK